MFLPNILGETCSLQFAYVYSTYESFDVAQGLKLMYTGYLTDSRSNSL